MQLRPIRNEVETERYAALFWHPRASEILNRRRPLTLEMIRKLADGLKLPADLLVKPYALQPYSAQTAAAQV